MYTETFGYVGKVRLMHLSSKVGEMRYRQSEKNPCNLCGVWDMLTQVKSVEIEYQCSSSFNVQVLFCSDNKVTHPALSVQLTLDLIVYSSHDFCPVEQFLVAFFFPSHIP